MALIGAIGGLNSGLLGVGGGITMVPLMVLMAGFTQRRAHALSLMAMVIIASVASVPYVMAGQVRWDWAAALAAGSIGGAQIGARLLSRAAEGPLKVGFATLLVVTAGLMVLGHPQGSGAILGGTTLLLVMVVVGVLVGALSGLLGIGGGIVMVPFMALVAGGTQQVAQGTSMLVIVPTAVTSAVLLARRKVARPADGVVMGVAGACLGVVGSLIALHLPGQILGWIFAALITVVAIRLLRDGLRLLRLGASAGQ